MLLQRLSEYADRLDIVPPMYLSSAVRWLINLDGQGNLLGIVSTAGSDKKSKRGKEFLCPNILRSSGVRAKLLADTGEYVLGIPKESSKVERVAKCHEAFIETVRDCVESTDEPLVRTVLSFLDKLDLSSLALPEDFNPGDTLTFMVDGQMPIDLQSVREFWADYVSADDSAPRMQCVICGEEKSVEKRLPMKIKRIPGGQTSGMALISANSPAFESYGLEASLIAPTCRECGERFSHAANALLANESSHVAIGPVVYIFWTKEESDFSFASFLSKPDPDEVKALLDSFRRGSASATEMDTTPFYAAAFSASGARVAVRDWIDTTLGEVQQNLVRYFLLQGIVQTDGSESAPLPLFALAAATVRDVAKELAPNVPEALLRLAIKGGPMPSHVLHQTVRRNQAEQGVTRPRAALVKMVLLSQEKLIGKEDIMAKLDLSNTEPAYLCGRLLSVLESIQREAIPGLNQTLVDRFYGAASSAPASVFGRLMTTAQSHLGKLRNEKRGAHEALQQRLEAIQAGLTSFPRTLTLEQQGLFALGYYHQRAANRAAAIEAAAKKKGTSTETANEKEEKANE